MIATFESVLRDALGLPMAERSRIASRLLESVEEDPAIEMSPEWHAEINRRISSIRDGTAKLIEHDEVMARVHH